MDSLSDEACELQYGYHSFSSSCNKWTVLMHDHLAELLPLITKDFMGSSPLMLIQAAVVDTPRSELPPTVQVHCGISHHHLIKLMR